MGIRKKTISVILAVLFIGSDLTQAAYAGQVCEHDIDYCSNGDGTHYVYCTEAKCRYERTEDCAYLEGYCPYCGYAFPDDSSEAEEIREEKEAETENQIEKHSEIRSADMPASESADSFADMGEMGRESTGIVPLGYSCGAAGADGGVVTDWYHFEPYEIVILAQIMRHEAGNQPEAGQIGVVEVILNRMASPYFSQNTVSGIVYAPKQFSYAENSRTIVPTEYELSLVKDIILGNKRVFNYPNIMYFRNTMITSGFSTSLPVDWGSHKYATYIKDHAFYYQ